MRIFDLSPMQTETCPTSNSPQGIVNYPFQSRVTEEDRSHQLSLSKTNVHSGRLW